MSELDLLDFQNARSTLAGRVQNTAIVRLVPAGSAQTREPWGGRGVFSATTNDPRLERELLLKLECHQVTGSFKARGATHSVFSLPPEVARRGIITASGGNHGIAVAYAARIAGAPATVYLPRLAPQAKETEVRRWGAKVVRFGDVWDEAHAEALRIADQEGSTYVHAFADPMVVAGQGTIALEVLEVAPEVDLFVVSIGGGGLISGIAAAAKLVKPGVRVVGVEPVGAPTLFESVRANRLVVLPEITTAAGTLAPRASAALNLDIVKRQVDEIVLVSDDEMREAAAWLRREAGLRVELAGAAAVAALLTRKFDLHGALHPCAIVCGADSDATS